MLENLLESNLGPSNKMKAIKLSDYNPKTDNRSNHSVIKFLVTLKVSDTLINVRASRIIIFTGAFATGL